MEKQHKQNIAVGLTSIAAVVGLGVLIMLFGYVPSFFKSSYLVKIHLANAAGLHAGSHARLSGINVGKVDAVSFAPPRQGGVIVTVKLREKVRLPKGTTAHVAAGSLLGGGAMVSFQPPGKPDGKPAPHREYLPTDGSVMIEGSAGSLVDTLNTQLQSVLAEPMKNIKQITDSFTKLSNTWDQVGQNLTQLTATRDPGAVDHGKASANLATVIARTDARLAQTQKLVASMQDIFGDAKFRGDLKQTVAQANQLTSTLDQRLGKLQNRYVTLADRLSVVADAAGKLLDKANHGKGALGKLFNDSALYDNLNDASQRLQKLIDDARLLIQKWKAEGLPVQF